jgi:hypothetical protein
MSDQFLLFNMAVTTTEVIWFQITFLKEMVTCLTAP